MKKNKKAKTGIVVKLKLKGSDKAKEQVKSIADELERASYYAEKLKETLQSISNLDEDKFYKQYKKAYRRYIDDSYR